MTRAKGKAQLQYREPGEAKGILNLDEMTMAEQAKHLHVRMEAHMIYEMFNFSQYSDGSVFDCVEQTAYKAEHVLDSAFPYVMTALPNEVLGDLVRNAKAALKNGTTKNLAPKV